MEEITELLGIIEKRNIQLEAKYAKFQKEQIKEHQDLMNTVQILKEEREFHSQTLTKNLQSLSREKHLVEKLLQNPTAASNDPHSLPITHEFHRDATSLISNGIDFMKNYKSICNSIENSDKEVICSSYHTEKLVSSINSIENESQRIKCSVADTETLIENMNKLEE